MGNSNVAYAKEPAPGAFQPPPLTVPPPPNPEKPDGGISAATKSGDASENKPKNPGLFEELHRKSKEVYPTPFDGFRMAVNRGLSSHLQVSHMLNLSAAPNGTSCHFGATYVGTQTSPTEAFPLILGDIDNSGSLSAQIIHQFTNRIKGKCVVQTQQTEFAQIQMDADYQGDDCTATFTLGNIDILANSGIIVSHYLQRVTQHLDIGAELLYHYNPGQQNADLSLAGRYSTDQWIAAAQINPSNGWHTSYYQKREDLAIGVNYEYSSRLQESNVSLGYQYDFPKANTTVQGMLDTNWTVGATLQKRLESLPLAIIFSGRINHVKNQSCFGFALHLGG